MKISDTPLFKKQSHLFYQPFHFMRKILTTSSLEYFENSTAPSMGGRGSSNTLPYSSEESSIND